jgi:hypothetical protein
MKAAGASTSECLRRLEELKQELVQGERVADDAAADLAEVEQELRAADALAATLAKRLAAMRSGAPAGSAEGLQGVGLRGEVAEAPVMAKAKVSEKDAA